MKKSAFALAIMVTAICGCDLEPGGSADQQPPMDDKNNITILLRMFPGEGNVELAKVYKEHTEKDAHWKNLFVIHNEGYSSLYWGSYLNEQAAKDNLARARAYKTPTGEQVYKNATVVPIPGKDLIGPPEWNLAKAPGEFSILVAVFRNTPRAEYWSMRTDAVEYCKLLHDHGYEAYYYHSADQSEVTVGCFDKSAVQMVSEGEAPHNIVRPVIVDERMNNILKDERFKFLPVNGYQDIQTVINPKTGKAEKKAATPYPIRIPKSTHSAEALPPGLLELPRRANP